MHRLSLYSFTVAVLSAGSAFAGAESDLGSWDTDFGPMTLHIAEDGEKVTGEYPNYGGKVFASITPEKRIEGIWVQPNAKQMCDEIKYGSVYWGQVRWQVVQGEYLQGQWSYCDDEPGAAGAWNGGKPSVGRAFAKVFSSVLGVAVQVAGSQIGGGVGGQLANMALSEASSQVQSSLTSSSYAPPIGETDAASQTSGAHDYPSARRNRLVD